MRILYINHYAGSPEHGMEYRPYYLSREWAKLGHSVRILASAFSHVRAKQPYMAAPREAATEWINGVEYTWYPTPKYWRNGARRLVNIGCFLLQLSLRAKRLAQDFRPDVVIASSTYPMDIWVAKRVARLAGAKLVFEVHDLWPLSLIELGGMSRANPFVLCCHLAETFALRHANLVVSMLPHVHQHMQSRGFDLARLHIVPNGVDIDEWIVPPRPLPAPLAEHLAELRRTNKCVVVYLGSHGVPNALKVLLDAANILDGERYSFIFVGDGLEKLSLLRYSQQLGLTNVRFFPPIAKATVPSFLKSVDIAYIGWRRLPIYRFGIAPNKLFDYMMSERPVIHSVDAANNIVEDAGCGYTVPPENPAAVAAAIQKLAQLSVKQRNELGRKGSAYVRANHAYELLAKKFMEAVSRE
jgi:glycosyltransferase involved in cell wall biosynthesis